MGFKGFIIFTLILGFYPRVFANKDAEVRENKPVPHLMDDLRKRIAPFNWDATLFHDRDWLIGGYSVNGMPLLYWTCGNPNSSNRSLVLSAVHGDEITPVYFGFRLVEWVKARPELCEDKFIVIAPIVNPDGFLRYTRGTRTNYNKVDLNRNFKTPEWAEYAHKYWTTRFSSRRRYYPGERAGDQPETIFQKWLIQEFRPQKILSVHAPLNILDYDGPIGEEGEEFARAYFESCYELKDSIKSATSNLRFFAYGTFPGSLGNYAGRHLGIPTITVELPTIDASKAMRYFSDMERGNIVFFEYQIEERPDFMKERERQLMQARVEEGSEGG